MTPPMKSAIKRLVLLGAGHAHVHVLKSLIDAPLSTTEVTLVSPYDRQVYSGMLPGWVAGHYQLEECVIPLAPLVAKIGVQFEQTAAVHIDFENNEVHCANGNKIAFDLISIDTGPVADLSTIPGAAEHAISIRPIESFIESFRCIKDEISARAGNDKTRIAFVGAGVIAHGIRIAYGSEVPVGRNPTYALHIEIPPMEVDVNVHPTKSEVRFKRLRDVHDLIYSATRQALREPLVVTATPGAPNQHARKTTLTDSTPSHTRSLVTQAIRAFSNAPIPSAMQQGNALVGARYSVTQDAREQWLVWDLVRWFEQLLETLGPTPEVRLLMIPVRLPTPPPASVLQALQTLARVGFEVTEVAPERWVLRGVPAVLPDLDPRIFVEQLLRVDDPITAAVALAAACELPTDLRARATRLAEWAALATSRGIAPGKYQRTLGPEMLAGIFAGPAGV